MKVTGIETLTCDAGWRNYHFVKLTTDERHRRLERVRRGLRLAGRRRRDRHLTPRVVGQPVGEHERIYAELYCATRPGAGGVVAQAMGAIENALIDAKAKALGVPCYQLLGGKVRDRIRVYWSHCATWRINHPTWYKPAITDLDGVKAMGAEVREKRFTAHEDQHLHRTSRGPRTPRAGGRVSARRSIPSSTSTAPCCATCACTWKRLRDGAGPDVDMLLDLNFNAKTEGYLRILREIADLDMFWVEIDSYSPEALGYIRRQSPHPISSCETLIRLARVPALFPRAGDGCRHRRCALERHLAVDEGCGTGGSATRSTWRRTTSMAICAR